jgi:hypothetical protein
VTPGLTVRLCLPCRTEARATETYTQVFDNFAMRLAETDKRVYALIGIASDIRQNFFFRRLGGRWFLVRVEDLSM